MKITFTKQNGGYGSHTFGQISSTNNEIISENIISTDGLSVGLDIAKHQNMSIFDLLSHKVLYTILDNTVIKVLLIRVTGGIDLWNEDLGYIHILDKDVIYTKEEEAYELKAKYKKYEKLRNLRERLMDGLNAVNSDIEKLGIELGIELG